MADNLNPFTDVLPPVARKYAYAVATLALVALTIWQASDGNWFVFVVSLLTAVTSALAFSNTHTSSTPPEE